MSGPTALHWFTSDLRLSDNPALAAAGAHGSVAGTFVLDPASLARAADAPRRTAFLYASLRALDAGLREKGSRLVVLRGDPADEVPRLAARLGATRVTHSRNYEPAALMRAQRLTATLARDGIAVTSVDSGFIRPPGTVVSGGGTPYKVYSAFARAWAQHPLRAQANPPRRWVPVAALERLGGDVPAPAPALALPSAGEAAARGRLLTFLKRDIARYPTARDLPAEDATSRLSYHLRFGTISAAECCRRAREAGGAGARTWIGELAWRDFFAHLLHAFPHVVREPMRPLPIRWRRDDAGFRRWQEGMTGLPLVDAGMRELRATGFMHNRVRMVTASFLTRHLLLDWRLGERHFMAELLDAQLSQNDGNWQWVAGTGADAQPFHRIFSPVRQGERFDPDGAYVKRWVPELARVPPKLVHQPWELAPLERRGLCPDYAPPVVDLGEGRARALAAFEQARARR